MKWTRFFYDPDAIFSVRFGTIAMPLVALVFITLVFATSITTAH